MRQSSSRVRRVNRPLGGPTVGAVLVAVALQLVAGPARAQPLEVPGRSMSVVLRAGGYLPANELYSGLLSTDVLPPRLSIGVALENDLGYSPFAVRLTVDAVPSYSVAVRLVCPDDRAGSCPDSERLRYRLGVASVDLVLRPIRLGRSVPYLHAGPAVKGYVREDPSTDRLEPTLRFGGGVEFDLAGRRVSVDVSNSMSWFAPSQESATEIQHDVVVAAGLRLGL